MRVDPVDEAGRTWLLERAAAFKRVDYHAAGYYELTPWFTPTQLARHFAESVRGKVLSRQQVVRIIRKYDPDLWKKRVTGETGRL